MNDDMNTPEALSVLFDLAHKINKESDVVEKQNLATTLVALGDTLGILQCNPKHYLQGGVNTDGISTQQIETLIAKRKQARADKDWALGDKIRDDLLAQGIELEDGAQGTTWRR
jgi:cysteinyl-tRNA synthetase